MSIKRCTNTELFNAVWQLAMESGELTKLIGIEDYHLPETFHVAPLTDYSFDPLWTANYGGNEGIYIDGIIRGVFDDSKQTKTLKLGTIKTLDASFEAMKIMGEACGVLTYFSRQFVNKNIDNFTPEALLRQWGKWE